MLRQLGFLLGGSGLLTAGLLGGIFELDIIGGLLLSFGIIDSSISIYDFLLRSAKVMEKSQDVVEV